MTQEENPPASDSEEDYQKPGPFAIPARNWFLVAFLWSLLIVKYVIIFGGELPLFAYLGGSLIYFFLPWIAGRVAWKSTGERPYWGDNCFIGMAALLFLILSIPAYTVGMGGA